MKGWGFGWGLSGFVKLDGAAPKAGKVQGRYPVRPAFGRYTPGGGQRVPMIRPVPPSTARAKARGHRRGGEANGSSATARRQHDRKKREGRHERRKKRHWAKKGRAFQGRFCRLMGRPGTAKAEGSSPAHAVRRRCDRRRAPSCACARARLRLRCRPPPATPPLLRQGRFGLRGVEGSSLPAPSGPP